MQELTTWYVRKSFRFAVQQATSHGPLLWLTAFEKQLPKELSLVSDSAEEIY
jgi:hypothetical protein